MDQTFDVGKTSYVGSCINFSTVMLSKFFLCMHKNKAGYLVELLEKKNVFHALKHYLALLSYTYFSHFCSVHLQDGLMIRKADAPLKKKRVGNKPNGGLLKGKAQGYWVLSPKRS